jgi:hypothetical protein
MMPPGMMTGLDIPTVGCWEMTLAELEDAVEELSKTIWLAPAVVAEVLKKAREAER